MSTIEQIKALLDEVDSASKGVKVGVAITTYNRYDVFKKSHEEIKRFLPKGAVLVVVDDASTTPVKEADYRFEKNAGIAAAKNKCLDLLYKAGCTHFFLFDDDCYPLVPNWHLPYINHKEPHLNYNFGLWEVYRDSTKVAYLQTRGVMVYCTREVLDRVGGMDTVYGKWGCEHPSWSDRIYMAGLTSFRYMDIASSKGLFMSLDEHEKVVSTVTGKERDACVEHSEKIFMERRHEDYYFPFMEKENVILTCYFNGVKDTQDNRSWASESKVLQPLIKSVKGAKVVVLTDCLEDEDTDAVKFVRVETSINPYFQRWVSYREWLVANKHWVGNVFCVDGSDVEMLNEPDWSALGDYLYTGDENKTLDDEGGWMKANHKAPPLVDFFKAYGKKYQLVNAGILGGQCEIVIEFCRAITDFYYFCYYDHRHHGIPDAGTTDMGAFNYVVRKHFNDKLRHGGQVCTRFKAEERNGFSWFKHK